MDQIIFVNYFLCVLVIALSLIVLEAVDFNLVVFVALCNLFSLSLLAFMYSVLSEMITTSLEDIAHIFYASPWKFLSFKHHILITLPIQRAQCEFRLKGLDLLDCSLAVFSSV